MLLRIDHETKLTYSEPVAEHVFEVRMSPLSDEDQTTLGYRLRISPSANASAYRDGFGNRVDLFNLFAPCQQVHIQATSFVRTQRRSAAERLASVAWPGERPVALEAMEFLQSSPLVCPGPEVDKFLATLPASLDGSLQQGIDILMDAVRGQLKYEKKVTTSLTRVDEALALGSGVCQDFAHLLLAACRDRGVPARYVSGYVKQPGEIATHAWVQVWGGSSVGWLDVDPTHRKLADDDYVVIAVGRDYSDIPPNRGAFKGNAEEGISVTVTVELVQRLPVDWIELERLPGRTSQGGGVPHPHQKSYRTTNGLSQQRPVKAILRHQKNQQQQSG